MIDTFWGLLIPFLGTSLGAACVFFMQGEMNRGVERGLTGFASGVMVAASIWSLLIPALDECEAMGRWAFLPPVIGFGIGMAFLLLLDHVIPHLHMNAKEAEGPKSHLARTTMLVLAVTLHNIPEGMAVGVVYAGFLSVGHGAFSGDRDPEFSGRRDHFHAAPFRRDGALSLLRRRGVLRHSGAYRRYSHHSSDSDGGADDALSPFFCGRGDDVCRGGGADPGNVSR